ncbi:MAG: hypothetical protein WAL50_20820 [Kineosporiaceae bacterium]
MTTHHPPRPVRALFVHHSVGGQLLRQGRLRERLAGLATAGGPVVELWDHDYNQIGLSDGTGTRLGRAFPVPDDDTDPPGLLRLVQGDGGGAPYLAELTGVDVLLLKSCFPNNRLRTDQDVTALRQTYQALFDTLGRWPSTRAVLLTSPPLHPRHTSGAEAARARELAAWLLQTPRPDNVGVFDLFGVLAAPDGSQAGMLRRNYRRRFRLPDSHPNDRGAQDAAVALTDYLAAMMAGLNASAS